MNTNYLTAFSRTIGLGFTNFWRNKILSIATILVIAVILFIFNIILAVHFMGNQALKTLSDRVDLVIYLRDDISFYDAKNLSDQLQMMEGVKTVKYISKEEALEKVSQIDPRTAEFLKKFNVHNPLPPSINIKTNQPEDYKKIEAFLEQPETKNLMKNYVANGGTDESVILSSVAKNLSNITSFVKQIIFWLVLVFIVGGILVIANAIQLTIYTRRQEIFVMRLVGATPSFISLPFIFEGIIYSICAVVLSIVFLILLAKTIQMQDLTLWSFYSTLQLNKVFVVELLITMALGGISSFLAVEQYLKVRPLQN